MLDSRTVEDRQSLCPAAYALGETLAGSGVLCRVSGRVVASGTDPSSLRAFCWCPVALGRGPASDGSGAVGIGYQSCPVWQHNRRRELAEKVESLDGAPERVKQAMEPEFVTRA